MANIDSAMVKVYQSNKTVLSSIELASIWGERKRDNLKAKISYYVKRGSLIRLTRGIFAKDKTYNLKELANSLYIPSYISFETVLREAGVIFQHYETMFIASKWSKSVTVDGHIITSRKLKDILLFNPTGVDNSGVYSIATIERAFLDMIYLFPDYYFDNLSSINWDLCEEMVGIYKDKEMAKRLKQYRRDYAG